MTAINRMDGMAQRVKFRALKSTPDTITAFKATSGQHSSIKV
jgi:2-isopropylmalate synthase